MIEEFQGEYRWLSNFYPVKIVIDGVEYPSVEHAYCSCKSTDSKWKSICSNEKNPGKIKRKSKKIKVIDDWDDKKLSIMKKCLEQKFNQEPFKSMLIQTGNEIIQEGNRWNDKFYGVCLKTNKGKNKLGKLIMNIRYELINGPKKTLEDIL